MRRERPAPPAAFPSPVPACLALLGTLYAAIHCQRRWWAGAKENSDEGVRGIRLNRINN